MKAVFATILTVVSISSTTMAALSKPCPRLFAKNMTLSDNGSNFYNQKNQDGTVSASASDSGTVYRKR